jgi:hypothetical protein
MSLLELGTTGAFAVGGVLLTTVLDTVLSPAHEFCIEKNMNIIVATAHNK